MIWLTMHCGCCKLINVNVLNSSLFASSVLDVVFLLRCMIAPGPRPTTSNAAPMVPNAFDIQPNTLQLLGSKQVRPSMYTC